MEEFKDIPGWEGLYQAGTEGHIKSLKTGTRRTKGELIMKSRPDIGGYLKIMLQQNKKMKVYSVHRLIALTWLSNPDNKKTVNHKNGIRNDNRLENIEWMTQSENTLHGYRSNGRVHPNIGRFNWVNCKQVVQYNKEGIYINKYLSMAEAERQTGILSECISYAICGKAKTAGGYIRKHLTP